MAILSFYIFDRHTECIYSKSWVSTANSEYTHRSFAGGGATPTAARNANVTSDPTTDAPRRSGPPRDKTSDTTKLIFGTVFSLRNLVRKLGGDDDAFISYRTGQYRLHYYETPANLRFVMLTDTTNPSMRNVLHQIYINLWVEYVVKNPLAPVEHNGGEGVRNELFELGLDQFVRGLQ